MSLAWYIALAEWPPHSCWECSGGTGQAYAVIAAHDESEALEMATERLGPQRWDDPRQIRILKLAEKPAPNHKRPCFSDFRIQKPRPMVWKHVEVTWIAG